VHESSLMRALLRDVEAVAAAEGAPRVAAIAVRIGALAEMSPAHFREHFDEAARGTLAEGARCDVELSAAFDDPGAQHVTLVSVEVEEPA